jgi:SPP1 gp7 family putative phage head morphogenesis protein
MMRHPLDATFLSKTEIRQHAIAARVAQVVDHINRITTQAWRRMLKALRAKYEHHLAARSIISAAMWRVFHDIKATVAKELLHTADWGFRTAVADTLSVIPPKWWAALPRVKRTLLERMDDDTRDDGELQLGLGPKRTATSAKPTKEEARRLLFKPPSQKEVREIIYAPLNGQNWEQRLDTLSHRVTNPDTLADIIVQQMAQGTKWQKIAKQIQPYVSDVNSSAKRIARTETRRVANKMQDKSYEAMGEIIDGFQIRNPLDERSRPAHAARSGRIYWKDPDKGEFTADEKSDLPDEPNCRCWYTVVMKTPDWAKDHPELLSAFSDPDPDAVDPVSHEQWFDQQPEKTRVQAVGKTRYRLVKDLLGFDDTGIHFHNFLDPETGGLRSLADLRGMERAELIQDSGQNIATLQQQQSQAKQLDRFGFFDQGTTQSIGAATGVPNEAQIDYPHLTHLLNGSKVVASGLSKAAAEARAEEFREAGIHAAIFRDPRRGRGASWMVTVNDNTSGTIP